MKVLMIQFMKGDQSGELESSKRLSPNLTLKRIGRKTFISKSNLDPKDLQLAQEGFSMAKKAVQNKEDDIAILDEINLAIDDELIPVKDLLQLAGLGIHPQD